MIATYGLSDPKLNLKEGFKFAYVGLLRMLADMDYDAVSSSCEGNLMNAFASSMDQMREKKIQLEVLNERNFTWSLEMIDFQHYVGAKIDRKENKKQGLKEFNPFMADLPNLTIYNRGALLQFAASIMRQRDNKPVLTDFTIETTLKISTNYKLNLKMPDGSKLIPTGKEYDDEVHFVKFEGMYPEFEVSLESIQKGMTTSGFSDWTIVDFDNFLQGNNHLL